MTLLAPLLLCAHCYRMLSCPYSCLRKRRHDDRIVAGLAAEEEIDATDTAPLRRCCQSIVVALLRLLLISILINN